MTRLCRAKEKILCSCECAKNTFNDTGDNGEGETPVPIPNTAVKPFCAESTELDTTWEGRTLPVTKREDNQNGCLFSFGNNKATSLPSRNSVRNSERSKGRETIGRRKRERLVYFLGHDLGG